MGRKLPLPEQIVKRGVSPIIGESISRRVLERRHLPLDPPGQLDLGRFQIVPGLGVHPAPGIGDEEAGESEHLVGCDGPPDSTLQSLCDYHRMLEMRGKPSSPGLADISLFCDYLPSRVRDNKCNPREIAAVF
jgi:hypothetical protein